jgi:hypothetical protein
MPEPIRYRNKSVQSGVFLVRYRIEMTDAGIPMPAIVFWMPMPTYGTELSVQGIVSLEQKKRK